MFILFALLFLPAAQADSIALACHNLKPPQQQGDERFVNVTFAGGRAELEIADLTSPFLKVGERFEADGAHYEDKSSHASAGWKNEKGNVVTLSLVFLGNWWGGNLRFHQSFSAPGLAFKAGEELDLRCTEK
jgi:hypothetical protein